MCTSFIHRGKDTIIAMNFDNNGMKYAIDTNRENWFAVLVDGGRGKYPSFGVNAEGVFFNNLVVESNGKGLYRRPSKKVTHTTKLITDILNGSVLTENLGEYLSGIEVVNTPNWSCHCMICDAIANAWIVEPGRGNLYNSAKDSQYCVMSNFSLWDAQNGDSDNCCSRYETASKMMEDSNEMDVTKAFEILKAVSQVSGEWITDLSMVYSKNKGAVYYTVSANPDEIKQHRFKPVKDL